jgi:hypothetical protein
VVDEQALSYRCGRVDLDTRNVSRPLAYGTCGEKLSAFIQFICDPVCDNRMKTGIKQ